MVDLRKVRKEAEAFVRAVDREVYENWAGLKPELNTTAIYERHASLFTKETLDDIGARRAATTGDEAKRLRYLYALLASTHLENRVKDLTDERTTEEAKREIVVGHHILPFRQSQVKMENEDDRTERAKIFAARNEVIGELNLISVKRMQMLHALAKDMGFRDYAHLFADVKGLDLDALEAMMTRLVERTESVYVSRMEKYLKPLRIPLRQAERHDIAYLFRGKAWDGEFRKEKALGTLKATLLDLGFDLDAQANIRIDAEERPSKSPRAFCVGAKIPEDIILVVAPHGGHDDYGTMLHEAGHAEHYANVDPKLPFEFKYLGDNSVTEGMAFCLEYITLSPAWLQDKVGLSEVDDFLDFVYTYKLYFLRRYAAKLRYERALHTEGVEGMADVYTKGMERVLRFKHPREHYLTDVDDGLYAAQYLRAWILEAQMSQALREMFGETWFREKEAGRFLKGIWSQGQKLTADELVKEFGYTGLDIDPLLEQLGRRLPA